MVNNVGWIGGIWIAIVIDGDYIAALLVSAFDLHVIVFRSTVGTNKPDHDAGHRFTLCVNNLTSNTPVVC